MKKFKLILFALLAVFVGTMATTSCCDDDPSSEQDPHYQLGAANYLAAINARINNGEPYIIVDFRSKTAYEKGHIEGSVWLEEATISNMHDNSLAQKVYEACNQNTNYFVFLVGGASTGLNTTIAGSVSSKGFGKKHTILLVPNYSAWEAKNQEDPEKFKVAIGMDNEE